MQAFSNAKLTASDAGAAATKAVPGQVYEVGFDASGSGPVLNVTVVDQNGAET